MKPQWIKFSLVFVMGALVGAAAGVQCQRRAFKRFWQDGPNTERLLGKLAKELTLDEAQKKAAAALLEARRLKMKTLHEETSRRIDALRAEMRAELGKLLSPEQQKEFSELQARWDAKRKSRSFLP